MKDKKILKLVAIGLMAALCYIGNYIQIPLFTDTRIHFGNVFIIMGGLLFGAIPGGLAAGVGSAIYDLFDPRFVLSAPTTFLTKFAMGFVCGYFAKSEKRLGGEKLHITLSAILGQLTYVILYTSKSYLEMRIVGNGAAAAFAEAARKLGVSSVNAVIAVAVAVPLYYALAIPLRSTAFRDMISERRDRGGNTREKVLITVIFLSLAVCAVLVKQLLK